MQTIHMTGATGQDSDDEIVIVQLGEEFEYRCLRLECTQCATQVTDAITTAMIYRAHGQHLELVTLEVEIIATGEIWVLQPVPAHSC